MSGEGLPESFPHAVKTYGSFFLIPARVSGVAVDVRFLRMMSFPAFSIFTKEPSETSSVTSVAELMKEPAPIFTPGEKQV